MGSMCSFLSGLLLIPSGFRYRHGSVWLQCMTYLQTLLDLTRSQWNKSGKSQDVFGVATAAQIDIDKTKLVERDNPLSRRVSQLTYYVTRFSHVYHLEICFRCVTSSQQWLRTSRGQWSWRSWGRETSLRLSSRWVVNKNVVHDSKAFLNYSSF